MNTWTISAVSIAAGTALAIAIGLASPAPVQAHRQVTATAFDDLWDTGDSTRRVCRHNKRKCVEIASALAYRMAESGAYADLNDNQFAAFAIKVASHIVDNDYTHDEQEGPPTGAP